MDLGSLLQVILPFKELKFDFKSESDLVSKKRIILICISLRGKRPKWTEREKMTIEVRKDRTREDRGRERPQRCYCFLHSAL